ncbi:MAG: hypothetical protein KBD19_05015 [Candidatus Moranbacteria bacterium]|nr:hypothetical protein [Candidatus Moranbacteria bacterium]
MLFLLSISLFFLSGWLFLRAVFGRHTPLSAFEALLFSFTLGVAVLDFSMIAIGTAGIPFSVRTILFAFFTVPGALLFIRYLYDFLFSRTKRAKNASSPESKTGFSPSRNEGLAFLAILVLTLFLRTFFLSDAGLPTSTDLGHHMYWSKLIVDQRTLPVYEKREIITLDGRHELSEPTPISDFIIGEHLPFSAIAILSGKSFFSAFPINTLYVINILSLLALMALVVRLSENILSGKRGLSPFGIGLAVLFLAGPLFAFSSPESKFVSGGVVGNLFGNLFIPLILLSLFRALRDKDSRFLSLGILLSFTLAYTHHLSSLILAFIFAGILISLIILFYREIVPLAKRIGKLFFSPYPISALLFAGIFFFLVAMPTYIETNAAETALGAPSKSTRTGLSFFQISDSVGVVRIALGVTALLVAFSIRTVRNSSAFAFVLGWSGSLLLMTLAPHLVFLDIPSSRIGSYLSFPMTILAGILVAAFPTLLRSTTDQGTRPGLLPGRLLLFSALLIFVFTTWNGTDDNRSSIPGSGKAREVAELFGASSYLAKRQSPGDLFLKDHNYLPADAWMKLFFMRGYEYPLSRGFFKRYEDETKPRERCTLLMISTPNLPEGKRCYEDLLVNLIAVNPTHDASQFEKSSSFSRIYAGDLIHVYERK